jgi:hypothetical protein
MRGRDVNARQSLLEQLGHSPLVLWMAKPPQEAHGGGLRVEALERGPQGVLVERPQHPIGARALGHRHPQFRRHEGRRVAGT